MPKIIFNMPDDVYHSIEALSCSGIKNLLHSPEKFWFQSWMNPNPPEREIKDYLERGTLWHCAVLEPENFNDKYVIAPWLGDGFEAEYAPLKTVDDMKSWLDDHGYEYKKSGKKADFEQHVQHHEKMMKSMSQDYKKPYLTDLMYERLVETHPDKTIITSQTILDDMEYAASRMHDHPYFGKVFEGGFSEVVVTWEDEDGIPMKCRIDKLKPNAILDYKTISAERGSTLDKVCLNAVKYQMYDLQAALYTIGVAHAVNGLNDGSTEVVSYFGDEILGLEKFIGELKKSAEKPFALVFQQTERPCAIRGKKIVRRTNDAFNAFGNGLFLMQQGIDLFSQYKEKFGDNEWFETDGIKEILDHEIYYG